LLMAVAMSAYTAMPLDFGDAATDSLVAWRERRCSMLPCMQLLGVHAVAAGFAGFLRVLSILTVSDWSDFTGRMFGGLEVSVIAGFQIFVAILSADDIHVVESSGGPREVHKRVEDLTLARPRIFSVAQLVGG